jgi:hypothetical protein
MAPKLIPQLSAPDLSAEAQVAKIAKKMCSFLEFMVPPCGSR